jgi:hypothetical protein
MIWRARRRASETKLSVWLSVERGDDLPEESSERDALSDVQCPEDCALARYQILECEVDTTPSRSGELHAN